MNTYLPPYATDESTDNERILFDKVSFETIGGILFLKVIHNSKKDITDIDGIDIGDKQIEPLRRAHHGKSILYILLY